MTEKFREVIEERNVILTFKNIKKLIYLKYHQLAIL